MKGRKYTTKIPIEEIQAKEQEKKEAEKRKQ